MLIGFCAVGVILWIGGHDVLAGRLTAGELSAFVFYAAIVASGAGTVSEVWGEIQRGAGATERLMELLDTAPALATAAPVIKLPPRVAGTIRFDEVVFAYPSRPETVALGPLSFAVNPGERVALVGPSGAGKSTLSAAIADELRTRGHRVERLDGDEVRQRLSRGLGFSKEDRDENIRRIGFVARLLSRNGAVAIAAAISPYRAVRDEIRREHDAPFVEVFVDTPIEVCEQRDVKGMYAKARRGEIKDFTGIDDPYEAPENAEIVIDTEKQQPAEAAQAILVYLEQKGYLAA